MIVQLILATGSQAGIAAPIYRGYYMVGRHPECQIRPKTRSVSRRHLLIHHDQSALLVIDLGSTSGTRINEEKIEPKRWYPISDGDVLRLGKMMFNVSIQITTPAPQLPVSTKVVRKSSQAASVQTAVAKLSPVVAKSADQKAESTRLQEARTQDTSEPDPPAVPVAPMHAVATLPEPAAAITTTAPVASQDLDQPPATVVQGASFVQGEAWQEFDIASFLHSADEVDREHRYESIRQSDAMRRIEEPDEDDGGLFEDTLIESDEGSLTDISSRLESDKGDKKTDAPSASVAAKQATIASATMGPSATRAAARRSEPAPKKSRQLSPRLSLSNLADLDTVKILIAVLFTVGVLGYAGYSAYQFTQGPPTKILDGID